MRKIFIELLLLVVFFQCSLLAEAKTAEEWAKLGIDLYNKGKYEQSLDYFDKALKINPEYIDCFAYKGFALIKGGFTDEGLGYFYKALDMDPNNVYSLYGLGSYYDVYKKDYDKALNYYNLALSGNPDFIPALNGKGYILYLKAEYEEAFECFEKVLMLDPENEMACKNEDRLISHVSCWNDIYYRALQRELEKADKKITVGCLTLVDWNLREANSRIVGKIKNNSSSMLSYVEIDFILYDYNGNQVGSTFTNITNLEPEGVWSFEALVLEDNVVKAKVVNLKYSY